MFVSFRIPTVKNIWHLSLTIVFCIAAIALFIYLCAFKILDRDFWWHVKAGQMMMQTWHLISIDPFAHTREGLPYLATHEWLAQVCLFIMYRMGGATGIILFRTAMMIVVFFLLLLIDSPRIWPNALLAIVAGAAVVPGFMDRPQLFTFLLLAVFLFLAFHFLESVYDRSGSEHLDSGVTLKRTTKITIASFIILEIIWVNMHGAAAFLGVGIVGALTLQAVVRQWWYMLPLRSDFSRTVTVPLLIASGSVMLALLLSPNVLQTFGYMNSLLHDRTIAFIGEWQPRDLHTYLWWIGPFWCVTIAAMIASRRHLIFCLTVFLATGYLSRQAFRHEMLFVIAATGITIFQLKYAVRWQEFLTAALRKPLLTVPVSLLLLFGSVQIAQAAKYQLADRDNLYGYGVFAPAQDAEAFVSRVRIQGKMFNTYGIGGYLIYTGYPHRKVYIDGRNVDYGFDFMAKTFAAQTSKEKWQEITDHYGITYALIDYDAIKEKDGIPFSRYLDTDPNWPLVYVDDWTAVYVKRVPTNAKIIDQYAYSQIQVQKLESNALLGGSADTVILEKELRRAVSDSPGSVKARWALAELLMGQGKNDEAKNILQDAQKVQSNRPQTYALLAGIASAKAQWKQAGDLYEKAVTLAGANFPNINYAAIADVFAKTGNKQREQYYRRKAKAAGQPDTSSPVATGSGNVDTKGMLNQLMSPEQAVGSLNDEGASLAEARNFSAAQDKFLQALKLNPLNYVTLGNLCALRIQQKNYSEALDYCKKALRAKPDFADAAYNEAIVEYYLGNYPAARTAAQKATKLGRDASKILQLIETKVGK